MLNAPTNYILYDGECPVCSRYVALTNLREVAPDIKVLDARERPDLVALHRAQGIEINQGMVLKVGDTVIDGSAAFSAINRMAEPGNWFLKRVLRVLSVRPTSRLLYPVLASGRQALLFLLRRKMI